MFKQEAQKVIVMVSRVVEAEISTARTAACGRQGKIMSSESSALQRVIKYFNID